MMKNKVIRSLFTGILILFSVTCTNVPETSTHFLTGTICDEIDGTLLGDVAVSFGDEATTTDSNGYFSISLGTTGTLSGDLSIYKSGYQAHFLSNMTINSSRNIDVLRALYPLTDVGTYPTRTMSGKIYYSGGSEIPDGIDYYIIIVKKGQNFGDIISGTYSGGYSGQIRFKANDCSIFIQLLNESGQVSHYLVVYEYDLSNPGEINQDFTLPDPALENVISNVTFQGDQIGNTGVMGSYNPDIPIAGITKSGSVYSGVITFPGPETSNTFDLVPFTNGSVFWIQSKTESIADPPAHTKTYMACGDSLPLPAGSATVVLPAIVDNGPSGLPDGTSIDYNSTTGALSIQEVNDTNYYKFSITEQGGSMWPIAYVTTASNSIILPQWLQNLLSGRTVNIRIAVGNFTNFFRMENYQYGTYAPTLSGKTITGSSFKKDGIIIP
ncbi:MAG: hypothetical protein JW863_12050 [Chitinispirillaceae bacterium]|nr:hypothetical protein [Chitinispirillaceae bacterium]